MWKFVSMAHAADRGEWKNVPLEFKMIYDIYSKKIEKKTLCAFKVQTQHSAQAQTFV